MRRASPKRQRPFLEVSNLTKWPSLRVHTSHMLELSMRPPEWPDIGDEIRERLCELFEVDACSVTSESPKDGELRAIIGRHRLVLHYERSSRLGPLVRTIEALQSRAARPRTVVSVIVVPYMSQPGRERCKAAGLSWIDLCGNASVRCPGFTGKVEGRPDRFRETDRPATAFAPRSSRIVRQLLIEPALSLTQRELARVTGLSEPLVSRVVRRLESDDLVVRDERGAVRARAPGLLLDAWRESYDFGRHDLRRGHVPARDGLALFRSLAKELDAHRIEHAATGLGAAWLFNGFAAFNTATFYVRAWPDDEFLASLGFREGAPAANVWLVRPNDEGVFQGALEVDGVRCVHPVQIYLDLKGQPERAPEAGDRLRRETLTWGEAGDGPRTASLRRLHE